MRNEELVMRNKGVRFADRFQQAVSLICKLRRSRFEIHPTQSDTKIPHSSFLISNYSIILSQ